MTRKIIVAFDGSEGAEDALTLGAWLGRATRHDLLVVDVYPAEMVPVLPGLGDDWISQMREGAELALTRARGILDARGADGADVDYQAVPGASAARALDALGKQTRAVAIVLGSSNRGVLRRLASSHTADRLLQGAANPVVVAPRGLRYRELHPPRDIGCAFLPTSEGRLALRRAAELAERAGARLTVFCVPSHEFERQLTDPRIKRQYAEQAGQALRASASAHLDELPRPVEASVQVLTGGVVDALAALDEEDCQLLVCGSRGYGPAGRVLLGGVSSRLMRRAACPVMVVPRPSKG